MTTDSSDDLASALEQARDGWSAAMGLHFVKATADEVIADLTVGPQHLQGYGIVHGGVYCGIVETLASVGAAIAAIARGQTVVGLENHTSFLHAVREGTLRGVARPLARGRRSHVWEATISDAKGKAVATGRVRLITLEPEASLAGESVKLQG